MSLIIKLIYREKIKDAVKAQIDQTDATQVKQAVQTIFSNMGWTSGFWESAKKSAIKSILKEKLLQKKAEQLPFLSNAIMKEKLIHLTPEELHKLCEKLQGQFLCFSPYEINYLLRADSVVNDALSLHKAAIKRHREEKDIFYYVSKRVSKETKTSQEAVDREVYSKVFGKPPEGMLYPKVIKALQTVPRGLLIKIYKQLKSSPPQSSPSLVGQGGTSVPVLPVASNPQGVSRLSKDAKIKEFIQILCEIPNESAIRIEHYLKDPFTRGGLTREDVKYLVRLFSYSKPKKKDEIKELEQYLPQDPIYKDIFKRIYGQGASYTIGLQFYFSVMTHLFNSYSQQPDSKKINAFLQSEIKETDENNLKISEELSLKVTEAFSQENGRHPDTEIVLPDGQKIFASYEGDENAVEDHPHQEIAHGLYLVAKGDEDLSLRLQSLCSQTLLKHFNDTVADDCLNEFLGLSSDATSDRRFLTSLVPKQRTIAYVRDGKITISYDAGLTIFDAASSGRIEEPLTIDFELNRVDGNWVASTPVFTFFTRLQATSSLGLSVGHAADGSK